ncbi:MAG: histidine kinase [Clostridiales bacterium]|jgi:sensor histidine kinase YesM|nr:histidine kinase [Clostridiales bacterium]
MYLLHTLIIVIAISALGLLLAGNISGLIVNQALDYNRQQLSSLSTAYQQQIATLDYLKGKIYEVKTGPETNLYESVEIVLHDNRPFASAQEYNAYINHAELIHTFFNLVQSSLQIEMSLFQINGIDETGGIGGSGSDSSRGNMNLLWPSSNAGMMEYAREINAAIAANPPDGLGGQMLAFVSSKGARIERSFYVLYDYLFDKDDPQKLIGLLINGYETRRLGTVFDSFSYPLEGTAYILAENGSVIFDSDYRLVGAVPDFFSEIASLRDGENSVGGYVYNIVHNTRHGYYVVGRMQESSLSARVTASNLSILALSLLCAAVAVVLALLCARSLLGRVREITRVMAVTETGDLSVRARVSSNGDEIDQISASLNSMIAKIDEHIHAEYINELRQKNAIIQQREAELFALQAQVNPHFLYNTLEIIRIQAVTNGDNDTALLIRWLASLFRRRTNAGTVVTIEDELAYSESLIDILQAKFNGDIDVRVEVPAEIRACAILKDLIQPLLENAFVHGFADDGEDRRLTLSGERRGCDIALSVCNSGPPIQPEALERVRGQLLHSLAPDGRPSGHVGLVNVDQRIRLVFGEGYGVSIESDERHGTVVTLLIKELSADGLNRLILQRE